MFQSYKQSFPFKAKGKWIQTLTLNPCPFIFFQQRKVLVIMNRIQLLIYPKVLWFLPWCNDIKYLTLHKFESNFTDCSRRSFSLLHSNIGCINENFESFREIYLKLCPALSIICFSEKWASEENMNKKSIFQVKHYNGIHQVRNFRKKWVMYICSLITLL